jgi:hypothetical protein
VANAGDYVRASDTTRYYCKGTASTAQSIPTGAFTPIIFNNTDEVDTLGIHDPVTNNTQFNIGAKLGWWWITGKYATTGSATGIGRRTRFLVNGTTSVNGSYSAFPSFSGTAMTGGFWTCESTSLVQSTTSSDYIEFTALQDTGGALNTVVSGDLRCQMLCIYMGA